MCGSPYWSTSMSQYLPLERDEFMSKSSLITFVSFTQDDPLYVKAPVVTDFGQSSKDAAHLRHSKPIVGLFYHLQPVRLHLQCANWNHRIAYLSVFPFTLEYAICGLSVESIFIAENHPNFDPESIVWLCQPVCP